MNEEWYKLDNVAKVFLANHSNRNPQSLRISFTLNNEIDPEILQKALDETILVRPQLQVRVRRGVFWHYMEPSTEKPLVSEESRRPCPVLYGDKQSGYLHYKVSYYKNRINLDVFHAIADGTGAMRIMELLVSNYLKHLYPDEFKDFSLNSDASTAERFQNSFDHFYDNSNGPIPKTILSNKINAYHIQSKMLPYDQLQFFEIHFETDKLRKAAKELNISFTSYIGAKLMFAIKDGMPYSHRKSPVTISMPVNLRNYYPSETVRNFFNNIDVSHVFTGNEDLLSLAKEFDASMKAQLAPDEINNQMNRYQSIEKLFFTRMVPLVIKQPVVKAFSKKQKKRVSATLSNLGAVNLPAQMAKHVTAISDFCSTESIFITVTSYKNDLVFGISSAYRDTGVVKRFIKSLQDTGSNVKAYISEVITN